VYEGIYHLQPHSILRINICCHTLEYLQKFNKMSEKLQVKLGVQYMFTIYSYIVIAPFCIICHCHFKTKYILWTYPKIYLQCNLNATDTFYNVNIVVSNNWHHHFINITCK
jgi:hypothetical protein